MPHTVLLLAAAELFFGLLSFTLLATMLDYLEMVVRVVFFVIGFVCLLATYFTLDHYYYEVMKHER